MRGSVVSIASLARLAALVFVASSLAAPIFLCACSSKSSLPAACSDGARDGDETDIDCGGSCGGCQSGQACLRANDCLSVQCASGSCGAPSMACSNGTRDGDETDTDCGGSSCPKCADGSSCARDSDCNSSTCMGGTCTTAGPSCTNGILDGSETDTDCGGGACPSCASAKNCVSGSDCQTGICKNGLCS